MVGFAGIRRDNWFIQCSRTTKVFWFAPKGANLYKPAPRGSKIGPKMFKKGSESKETRQSLGGSDLKGPERVWRFWSIMFATMGGSGYQMEVLEFNWDLYQMI